MGFPDRVDPAPACRVPHFGDEGEDELSCSEDDVGCVQTLPNTGRRRSSSASEVSVRRPFRSRSHGSSATTRRARRRAAGSDRPTTPVDDLPDLTRHLQSLGLYAEYRRFRDGYMKWRQGGTARRASGEVSARQFSVNEQRELEEWCPPYAVWRWRRTISYWVAVAFSEGSLLFTISSTFGCLPWATQHELSRALVAWPNFIGGSFFTLGAYFMCLEVVNLRNHGAVDFWPFARKGTLERLAAVKVSKKPYYAALSYFIGCWIFNTPLVVGVFDVELSPNFSMVLVKIPYLIGGMFFVLGGIFECLENEVFTTKPDSRSKWSALLNGIGGIAFFVAAVVNFWSDWWCSFLFAVGSAILGIAAVMSIFMWKDEQFGLGFIAALNSAARKSHASGVSRHIGDSLGERHGQFSACGTFFILFYCTVAVLVVYNAGLMLQKGSHFSSVYSEALPFFLMHMMLLVHSAVVQPPSKDNQPWHMLVMTARVLALTTGVNAFFSFTRHLPEIFQAFNGASAGHDHEEASPPGMLQRFAGLSAMMMS